MATDLALRDQADGACGLVAAWLATKRSPNTRAAYLCDITQWATWCAGCSQIRLRKT
jgi:hypothetical protein